MKVSIINEMCVGCHGAPGAERSEIGRRLHPHESNLTRSAKELEPAELFWAVKNGIESTGMPAFGSAHSDMKILTIVAFLEKMKDMKPREHIAMRKVIDNKEHKNMKAMDTPSRKKI
jgi:mono/diheme cytochrome c family protein